MTFLIFILGAFLIYFIVEKNNWFPMNKSSATITKVVLQKDIVIERINRFTATKTLFFINLDNKLRLEINKEQYDSILKDDTIKVIYDENSLKVEFLEVLNR